MTASCTFDEMWSGDAVLEGEEVVMTFAPSFQDFESVTKTIGDASQVNQLLVHVYEEGSSEDPMVHTYGVKNGVVSRKVSIPFFFGKKYEVFFFAYKSGDKSPYTISETGLKGGITVAYPEGSLNYDALEAMDAFYAVKSVDLSQQVEPNVALKRPFAQVNLSADKNQLEAAKVAKVEITVSASTSYDFKNGPSVQTADLTFTFVSDDYFAKAETLGTTYLFVPSGNNMEATITLYDEAGNVLKDHLSVDIPLVSNNRTNLVFSGIEPAGPEGIVIRTADELEAFLSDGAEAGSKAVIAADIDMTGKTWAPVAFNSLELDGKNKTISGLSFSLFNEASDLTVYNLTINQANITGKSHVGALVNTLKGAATLTNVKVVSTSVSTTNGAAGGIVGYISKSTEKSREEECSVLFDGCQVNGVTVTGSASEGKFVGLLCGYDNNETVDFTGCSATNVTVADYASVYTSSNQSAWLESLDSKYDGWLGHETYRRGVVKFDGKRLVPRWDGTTVTAKADLLLYNDEANKYEVYSPFDLAGVRNVTASPAALYLMENVDMFGQGADEMFFVHEKFTKSKNASTDDNNFTAFSSIALLEGNSHCIYNLSLNSKGSDRYAFILSGDNNHIHQNINFHSCCTVVPHVVGTDNGQTVDKSYGATVVLSVGGATYTMRNVHAYDCKVFALQKTGILAGRIVSTTKSTIDNCSVNNCYIENYKCEEHKELFEESIVSAEFYSYGEIGPIAGFINYNANITNCNVNNTTINAYGQSDQKGNIANIIKAGTIPGRHVNQFIGDIRSKEGYTVSISNCSVSSNKYSQDSHSHSKGTSIPIIGEAYCLGAKIIFIGQKGDKKGTVKVKNIKIDGSNKFTSETSVTLQELM